MRGGMLLNKSNSKTDLCPLNISVIFLAVSFIGGRNRSARENH